MVVRRAPAPLGLNTPQNHDFPVQPPINFEQAFQAAPSSSGTPWGPSNPQTMPSPLDIGGSAGLPTPTVPQSAIPPNNMQMQHSFMPNGPIPGVDVPYDMLADVTMAHNLMPNVVMPHNLTLDGNMPHNILPDAPMPHIPDFQMCGLPSVQGPTGIPMLPDESNNHHHHQQAGVDWPSDCPDSSGLSREQSFDTLDSSHPGSAHSCGTMQASPMGYTSPMQMQIHSPYPPGLYPMPPRPDSGRVNRNHRKRSNRITPAQNGRRASAPEMVLRTPQAMEEIEKELEKERRNETRRASHNVVEKRYRNNLNLKYRMLELAIQGSVCAFPGGSCPDSTGKTHGEIAPNVKDTDVAEQLGKKNGKYSKSKAEIIMAAVDRLQQMVDENHMLKVKLAMYEASPAADSQQPTGEADGVHGDGGDSGDSGKNVQCGGKDVKTEA